MTLQLFVMLHFLKQTKNPFKKYFPQTEQRLIGAALRNKTLYKSIG
jgi:hypothetical protein